METIDPNKIYPLEIPADHNRLPREGATYDAILRQIKIGALAHTETPDISDAKLRETLKDYRRELIDSDPLLRLEEICDTPKVRTMVMLESRAPSFKSLNDNFLGNGKADEYVLALEEAFKYVFVEYEPEVFYTPFKGRGFIISPIESTDEETAAQICRGLVKEFNTKAGEELTRIMEEALDEEDFPEDKKNNIQEFLDKKHETSVWCAFSFKDISTQVSLEDEESSLSAWKIIEKSLQGLKMAAQRYTSEPEGQNRRTPVQFLDEKTNGRTVEEQIKQNLLTTFESVLDAEAYANGELKIHPDYEEYFEIVWNAKEIVLQYQKIINNGFLDDDLINKIIKLDDETVKSLIDLIPKTILEQIQQQITPHITAKESTIEAFREESKATTEEIKKGKKGLPRIIKTRKKPTEDELKFANKIRKFFNTIAITSILTPYIATEEDFSIYLEKLKQRKEAIKQSKITTTSTRSELEEALKTIYRELQQSLKSRGNKQGSAYMLMDRMLQSAINEDKVTLVMADLIGFGIRDISETIIAASRVVSQKLEYELRGGTDEGTKFIRKRLGSMGRAMHMITLGSVTNADGGDEIESAGKDGIDATIRTGDPNTKLDTLIELSEEEEIRMAILLGIENVLNPTEPELSAAIITWIRDYIERVIFPALKEVEATTSKGPSTYTANILSNN